MSTAATGVRLRQAVIVAAELDPVAAQLQQQLGLLEPYADPGVGMFGLRNAVFAIGDTFLEVISPTEPQTAAGRWLERNGGDGGYMLIFQFDDLTPARARVADLGIRVVWQADLPDISGTHLHPADTRGALISLDSADPPGSWHWGGPDWTNRAGTGAPGQLRSATVGVPDPQTTAELWGSILDIRPNPDTTLKLDGGAIMFTAGPECMTAIALEVPAAVRGGRDVVRIGGVDIHLTDQDLR